MRYLAKRGTGRDRYIKLLTVLGAVVHLFAAEKKKPFWGHALDCGNPRTRNVARRQKVNLDRRFVTGGTASFLPVPAF